MWIYLLKSSACLLVFLGFYSLVLEKQQMHFFKRFYLIIMLLLSFGIPLITFNAYVSLPVSSTPLFVETPSIIQTTTPTSNAISISYLPVILWSIYAIGVVIFGFKFLRNLLRLIHKIKHNPKYKSRSVTNVLLRDLIIPHTFFNYIFLNKNKFEKQQIPQEVFWHEEAHAIQKHSIDVICIELLQVLFWFNPLIAWAKRAIKLNHEFLADQAVLQKGIATSIYQQVLLAFSLPTHHGDLTTPELTNAINYSSIKKRFTIMKKESSKTKIRFIQLALIPIIALLIYGFSSTKTVFKEAVDSPNLSQTTQNKLLKKDGVPEKVIEEYKRFMAAYKATKKVNYQEYLRIVAIYDLMSPKQQEAVEKYPASPIPILSKTEPKTPSIGEFDSWKNTKEFALWLDDKVIDNEQLNNYDVSDISYYIGSFVHLNARSERFPQPYQLHLYTKEGFEETYLKSGVKKYSKLQKEYLIALEQFLDGPRTDNSDLQILQYRLKTLYDSFSEAELQLIKDSFKPVPPVPVVQEQGSAQKKATPKQVSEYNTLAEKYNAQPIASRIIKMKDFKRLEYLYALFSAKQKKEAVGFPEFPPPPVMDTIYTYQRLFKRIENNSKNRKANLIYLNKLFSEMNTIQKQKVKSPKNIILKDNTTQEIATPKMVMEYNAIASSYNKAIAAENITVHLKDMERMQYIYSLMTAAQKEKAEPYPDLPPMPTPPPPPNAPKIIEVPKQGTPANAVLKAKVKTAPEVIKIKGKAAITPTPTVVPRPPQPPKSPITFVKEMAVKGAIFMHENKEISSEKAIELLKKNKEATLNKKASKGNKPVFQIRSKPNKVGAVQQKTNLLDYAKTLARKNAKFYYNDKAITASKGIQLIEDKKYHHVETLPWLSKTPEVKIYSGS